MKIWLLKIIDTRSSPGREYYNWPKIVGYTTSQKVADQFEQKTDEDVYLIYEAEELREYGEESQPSIAERSMLLVGLLVIGFIIGAIISITLRLR